MKKITILMLHLQHGGIEKQSITFANELIKKYEVEIISTYDMNKEPAYYINPKVKIKYLIKDKPNRNEFKNAIKSKNPIKILKEGIKSIKILYLKNHLMKKEIIKLKTDYVLSTRIDFAKMLSRYAPKTVITMTQEHLHNDSEKYIKKVQKSFKNLDYLIVLGPGSKENYTKWLKENNKIKIIEIPNILENIPKKSAQLNSNNLISIGRLHPEKDFETLIKVFNNILKQLPTATLTIVGGGDELDKLQKLIQKLNIQDKVKITGMVSKEEVENYLMNSDIYVMTSIAECFPMVLLEASACGLPLISFDIPVGPKAIIENGKNGYLIPKRNEEEMTTIIVNLLKNKEQLLELGKTSKEMSYKYLPNQIMKKWENIFEK